VETTHKCEQCGESILAEHIAQRKAGKVAGRLLCPECVGKIREQRLAAGKPPVGAGVSSSSGVIPTAKAAGASGAIAPASAGGSSGVIHAATPDEADEPLSLINDDGQGAPDPAHSSIRAFTREKLGGGYERQEQFRRGLVDAVQGATRCRTFHAKLADSALAYMDNQINDWIDNNPEVHVKFATSTIGMVEAKQHQEPHVIVTVFY
jgi:hypothetical protein